MNPRNATISILAAAAIGAAVMLSTGPALTTAAVDDPPWKPKPGKIYPRIIQPHHMSNRDYTALMESKAHDPHK